MTPDAALAEVRRCVAGRTRYEGQERPADEVLAEEVERLREALREIRDRDWVENCLDPQWAARRASSALGETGGE